MCEPSHSINQFPINDELGRPLPLEPFERATQFAKKIGDWYQFSKMGKGHSESIAYCKRHGIRIPEPIRYEAHWWNREFKIDQMIFRVGSLSMPIHDEYIPHYQRNETLEFLRKDAEDSARIYADQVSLGSLQVFRRFFEVSIQQTDRPEEYFEKFRRMLSCQGLRVFEEKERRYIRAPRYSRPSPDYIVPLTKLCLGMTRKREFLNDAWSDSSLWIPDRGKVVGVPTNAM